MDIAKRETVRVFAIMQAGLAMLIVGSFRLTSPQGVAITILGTSAVWGFLEFASFIRACRRTGTPVRVMVAMRQAAGAPPLPPLFTVPDFSR